MRQIPLCRDATYQGRIILTNKDYPIHGNQFLYPLSEVDISIGKVFMENRAKRMLSELIATIQGQDQIIVVSGFRSYEEQKQIYDASMEENGDDFTKKYVALPNCSEHQTGLAVDVGIRKDKIDFIRPDFPDKGVCHLFRKMAPKYGFIERYPRDKEKITGIGWEPWLSLCGFPHSVIMSRKNLVLEEYVEFLKQFPHGKKSYAYHCGKRKVEISYKAYDEKDPFLEIPGQCPFQISGNNVDGVIVEVWII